MTNNRTLKIAAEDWPIKGSFTISRGAKTTASVVVVQLQQDGKFGFGECVPYAHYNESIESVIAQIETSRAKIETGVSRQELLELMPAGAARCALDCALWDLEAKLNDTTAAALANIHSFSKRETAYTISLGSPEDMATQTAEVKERTLLKIKLGGDGDHERMVAVREAAPNTKLILDANESWDKQNLESLMELAKNIKASLIEQPLSSNGDEMLGDIKRIVPVCADESLHTRNELKQLRGRYDCINIKLDKTGGLSKALLLLEEAKKLDFKIMVGCMVSTSLSMAPAMLLAQSADFVDLDGPLLLAKDRKHGLIYEGSNVFPAEPTLWG